MLGYLMLPCLSLLARVLTRIRHPRVLYQFSLMNCCRTCNVFALSVIYLSLISSYLALSTLKGNDTDAAAGGDASSASGGNAGGHVGSNSDTHTHTHSHTHGVLGWLLDRVAEGWARVRSAFGDG